MNKQKGTEEERDGTDTPSRFPLVAVAPSTLGCRTWGSIPLSATVRVDEARGVATEGIFRHPDAASDARPMWLSVLRPYLTGSPRPQGDAD